MFDDSTRREIERVARAKGWPAAALLAIAEVESAGKTGSLVNGAMEPVIRIEGHYFDKRLSGEKQKRARAAGLASPIAGKVANPATQAARWAMLRRMAEIDIKAAYESCSWGIGQVMGAHWAWLGYGSVDDFVKDARNGVYGQTRLMANYIDKAGLVPALKQGDWATFARGYNGPGYAKNGYHTKIAKTFARWTKAAPLPPLAKPAGKPASAQRPVPTRPSAPPATQTPAAPAPESSKPHPSVPLPGKVDQVAKSNKRAGSLLGAIVVAVLAIVYWLLA